MATKARQQYFADEDSLQKIRREFSIADDIQQKIDSIEPGAQVNKIETVKVNGTALVPDANKAVNVEVPEVIDNLYTVDPDNALSAKQGKLLYDYIQNIASRGRFLSNWNSATGLPMTNPSESPYPYKSGDYFVVSNVATSGGTNYRPDGSSYTIGQASTVVETEDVSVSDFYFYDGTNWLLLVNTARQIAVDSSLSATSTNPVENRIITNALNLKHPGEVSNVAPSNPVEGMLWYGTVNDELKVYDGSQWNKVGGSDIEYKTQAEYNALLPGALTDNKHYFIYSTSGGGGWQPGVNTLAYYPLTSVSTTSDQSGNNYNLTNSGDTTFGTYTTENVDCAYLNVTNRTALSVTSLGGLIGVNAPFTYSLWMNSNYVNEERGVLACAGSGWIEDRCITVMGDSTVRFYIGSSLGTDFAFTPTINADTWYHLVGTFDGTNMKVYLNGTLSQTTASGYTNQGGTTFAIGSKHPSQRYGFIGYVSNVIVENVAWTQQEITDYFNQTKANYGIS